VIVEVDADSEEEALAIALGQADTVPEEEWIGTFEPEDYFYDAECLVEDYDKDDPEFIKDGDAVLDEDLDDYYEHPKYFLLKADTFSGTGDVIYQPWIEDLDDLMLADMCMDWAGQLEEARQSSFSLAMGIMKDQIQTKNKKPAKLLPFKRPSDPDWLK
jgi:hypothetical protein